jgi:hypothetical protein
MKRNIIILLAFVAALVIVRSDGQTIIPNGQGVGSSSSSSSSGGGATSLSAITDFLLVKTSDSVMSINTSATTSAPVNGRIGSQPYSFTAGSAVTRSGTTCSATQYWYVASSGSLTMGHNASSCTYTSTGTTAITIATPITGFPVDSIPLWVSTTTTGVWDPVTGTADKRAFISAQKTITAGTNITVTETATNVTIDATSGGTSYDPALDTAFYRRVQFVSGFNRLDSYQYSTNCADANASATGTGSDTTSIMPWWWLRTNGDTTTCIVSWPYAQVWGGGIPDYFSGGSPILHRMDARMGKVAVNGGTYYVGWSHSNSNFNNFIGCRAVGTGNWFAVVRSGGSDVGTPADTGVANSTNSVKITVRNGTTTAAANSVTCSVGGTAATIAATVPASAEWYAILGASQSGVTATVLRASMLDVWFQGLP